MAARSSEGWLKSRQMVERVRGRSVTLGYKVVQDPSQQHLATNWTKHICMDGEGRGCRLPEGMLGRLESR